jgi:hypothetical protein
MIGHVVMEIERDEMVAAMQFYLNKSVFNVLANKYHEATVTDVHQRNNGNFVVEFDGCRPAPKVVVGDDNSNDIS